MATKKAAKKQTLKSADYVHLHNHTQYSLLDGLTKVPELVEYIKRQGMEAVAVTDHGTLSGTIEFYKAAKSAGIKPIIGMEAYVAARGHTDRDPGKDKNNYHLILLAMNATGYRNLMKLSTIANLEGFYYKPRIDRELLAELNEGLICLSGCASSEVGDQLRQGQYDMAKETAQWYKKVFGDRYYIELQDHGHPEHSSMWDVQNAINKDLLKLGKELDIPCAVTCDAHYLKHQDQEAHEILLCVQTGSFLSDEKRMSLKDIELHVTDPKEVIARWGKEYPEAVTNTKAIADRCDIEIELDKILIPKFPVPSGQTEKSYLEEQVYQGLAWRYGKLKNEAITEPKAAKLSIAEAKKTLPKSVLDRAEYELSVIEEMNFNGYFLIIADFIKWGKDKGIVFGPGRGSAAGSIISYALKITELDPLEYDLLFERFLNPDRISMPDIDIDIQDSRREEVIQYCVDKYGKDRVANIVTFGRMAARNAVRDVSRVLQVPYAEADRLAKMIPPPVQGRHIPLATSIKQNRELKAEYQSNQTAKQVFDLAIQLEGTIRSHGVHAAGVVITPEDVVHYTPLEMAQKGVVATQYSMGPVEELGLLKVDFLGLSNLTIIKNTLRIIKRVYGQSVGINTIPLDDKKTFELLARGDTTGVFQFESAGMKRYLKDLRPTVFEDIVAMGALYRPGPMQFIDDFIARKNGRKETKYLHPKMKTALETTYGVLVYQEQVMQISKDLAGFTGGQADTLRKGIAKKIPTVLAKMKIKFIDGAVKNSGADRGQMEQFWKQLEDFAAYCFNKSHAACYGLISYQTAYLKAHYPDAFMAALMTSDYDNTDRLAIEITECQYMGITVLPPDVNESFVEFAVVPDKKQIRFGLAAIKNVGTGAVEEILRARDKKPFKHLEDFLKRVDNSIVNRKTMESLMKAGAFDRFGDRGTLLHNLEAIMAFTSRWQKQANSGQTDLFGSLGSAADHQPQLELQQPPTELENRQQLQWERELLGLYLSQHPLEDYKTILSEQAVPLNSLQAGHEGKIVTIGGIVASVRDITTKNGRHMAFIRIEDHTGAIEVILFPGSYEQFASTLQQDKVVLIKGKVNSRDKDGRLSGEIKLNIENAKEITVEEAASYQATGRTKEIEKPVATSNTERVYIRLANSQDEDKLMSLKKTIDSHKGNTEVVLVLGADASKQAIKLPGGIDPGSKGLDQLKDLVGTENLVIR